MSKQAVPAREGWFTMDSGKPRLLGSQCKACKTWYFPAHSGFCRNPNCDSTEFEQLPLSERGRIWSYTDACYQPPPPFIQRENFEPFAIAAVELEQEKIVVLGQLVAGVSVDDVSIGTEVQLVLETLYEDDEHDYLVWKWQPISGAQV